MGRSRPHISNTIRLLNLPATVQKRVAAGVLSAGHARALLSASRTSKPRSTWPTGSWPRGYRCERWRRSSRSAAQAAKAPRQPDARPKPVAPGLRDLADRLSDAFDTRVKVELGQRKGKIVVEFASLDDLERIVGRCTPAGTDPVAARPAPRRPTVPRRADIAALFHVKHPASGTAPRSRGGHAYAPRQRPGGSPRTNASMSSSLVSNAVIHRTTLLCRCVPRRRSSSPRCSGSHARGTRIANTRIGLDRVARAHPRHVADAVGQPRAPSRWLGRRCAATARPRAAPRTGPPGSASSTPAASAASAERGRRHELGVHARSAPRRPRRRSWCRRSSARPALDGQVGERAAEKGGGVGQPGAVHVEEQLARPGRTRRAPAVRSSV